MTQTSDRQSKLTERTVAVVLAGGKGTRLDPLTRTVCKPALPFGAAFRCIDFSLSNCVNSDLRRIAVATQHKPDALLTHLWNAWNSIAVGDEAVIRAWRAEERAERFGYRGTADAVHSNLASIRDLEDSLVLVLAGDHIYKMDYRPMLRAHCARKAAVTIGCVEAPLADACHFGVLAVGQSGCVERFVEKPRCVAEVPAATDGEVLVSMGIYVFDGAVLARTLATDSQLPDSTHDFGADILPRLLDSGRAYAFELRGAGCETAAYWRDIGTLRSYWQAHMELLGPTPRLTLTDPSWPLGRRTAPPRMVARPSTTAAGGILADSLAGAGCTVAGRVLHSVLADAVEVQRGATVTESVVLPGAVIGADSWLEGVIVDADYRVAAGTVIERYAGGGSPSVLSTHQVATAGYAFAR